MNRMADTVISKSNAAEKELEKRLLQQALERDKKLEEQDRKKKEEAKMRDIQIRTTLAHQMNEKKKHRLQEEEDNKKFVKMIIDQDEQDRKIQRDKKTQDLQKLKALQEFRLGQMGALDHSPDSKKHFKKQNSMHPEEMRMNRELIKEIHEMKQKNS
jgi:hypothetical protein